MRDLIIFILLIGVVCTVLVDQYLINNYVILIGLALFFLLGNKSINILAKLQNKPRDSRLDLPNHEKKSNIPSMGGVLIVSFVVIFSLILCDFVAIRSFLFLLLGYFFIGLIDDVLKVKKVSKYGFSGKYKLFCEVIVAYCFLYILQLDYGKWASSTQLRIADGFSIDIGYWFMPFAILVIVSLANSVNLTDGLDGLVTMPIIFSLIFIALIISTNMQDLNEYTDILDRLGVGHIKFTKAERLRINFQFTNIRTFVGIVIAGCIGFLFFNKAPAKIFMGDCGSLALGGLIGGLAVCCKVEILMIIVGFIFLVETLSVIIQVISFKTRGKRVFKIAPLHHHYEASGFSENFIVNGFWIISGGTMIMGFLLYFSLWLFFILGFIYCLILLGVILYSYF